MRPATFSTDSPPAPIQDVELAEYVNALRRRVEVDLDQLTALAEQFYALKGENARLKFEVDKLSLDLNIHDNPQAASQWTNVKP
jgi:regulator of replication initiation timing